MQFYKHLIALALILLASGCAESKELTRSRATTLISNAKDFKEPAVIALKDDYGELSVPAQSADEEETEAQVRAVEDFLDNHPALAVLKHLAVIEVIAQTLQKPKVIKAPEIVIERPDGTSARSPVGKDRLEPWKFSFNINLTEKGRKAAGSDERTIPLYTRKLIEITGIINTQNGGAKADFTWRAVPTSIGKSFDPTSEEYKILPPKLQRALKEPTGLLQRTPFANTSEINTSITKGVAYFQRYDDGWRLTSIQ